MAFGFSVLAASSRSISLIMLQAVPFITRITSCSFKKLLIVSKGDAKGALSQNAWQLQGPQPGADKSC